MTATDLSLSDWGTDAPTRSRRRSAGQLRAVLRSEWIKFTTVRANKVILVLAAAVGLVSSWAPATFITDKVLTVSEVFVFPTTLTAVLATIAGIVLFTAEVQHGTLAGALTAHPARWPVVVAKSIVATGYGLALGLVGVVTGTVGALAGGLEIGDTAGMPATAAWALLFAAGSGVLGLGIGMVVRHSAGAVSGVLVWWLVIESLVLQFAPAQVLRFLPFDAGFRTMGVGSDFDSPEVAASALPSVLHAAIFWGYVVAAVAIGAVLLHRRDAD
jgi:ABC-2 type transport system permease protein